MATTFPGGFYSLPWNERLQFAIKAVPVSEQQLLAGAEAPASTISAWINGNAGVNPPTPAQWSSLEKLFNANLGPPPA
jgi:hypothetical protein